MGLIVFLGTLLERFSNWSHDVGLNRAKDVHDLENHLRHSLHSTNERLFQRERMIS